jgi:hypothetical protein
VLSCLIFTSVDNTLLVFKTFSARCFIVGFEVFISDPNKIVIHTLATCDTDKVRDHIPGEEWVLLFVRNKTHVSLSANQKMYRDLLIVKMKTCVWLDLPFILRIFTQVTHKRSSYMRTTILESVTMVTRHYS